MRFLRHVIGALVLVAVIVAGGVAWEQASPPAEQRAWSPPLIVHPASGLPPTIRAAPGQRIQIRPAQADGAGPVRPAMNLKSLVRTSVVELCIAAIVVAISAGGLRRRRRRRRTLPAHGSP